MILVWPELTAITVNDAYVVPGYHTCMIRADANNTVNNVHVVPAYAICMTRSDTNNTVNDPYVVPAYNTCMTWADPNNAVDDVRRAGVWYLYDLSWPQ
jgi:hypothetical protein